MKRIIVAVLAFKMVLSVGIAFADDTTGNGSPKAKKVYSLNIIGVPKNKNADMDDNSGHRIFVPLVGKAKIELIEGNEFAVLDANGTDGPAQFQLPAPGIDAYLIGNTAGKDTMSDCSVYIRPLGKPGGWATITTCAELLDSDFASLLAGKFSRTLNANCDFGGLASIEQIGQDITFRHEGKSTFQNVTAELLTIVFQVEVELMIDGVSTSAIEYVRVPIFDDIIQGEYWEYDNQGLKILQARFYEFETDVSANDGSYLQQ